MSDTATEAQAPPPEPRGFQIGKRFYPAVSLPGGEKLGDPAIVRGVTDLSWDTFLAGLGYSDPTLAPDEQEAPDIDETLIFAGMVAIAIAHERPDWNRQKIVSYVTQLPQDSVDLVGFESATVDEPEQQEDEDLPPTSALEPGSSESLSSTPEPTTASGEPTPAATRPPSAQTQD